jgi:hypothetical protein
MSKPSAPQLLSDKQLNLAIWFYEKRSSFIKAALFGLAGLGLILLLVLLIQTILWVKSLDSLHRLVLRDTQHLILQGDPITDFQPQNLQIETIHIIKHKDLTDIVATINNPNQNWAAFSFDYNFTLGGVFTPTISSFALPGKRYILGFTHQEVVPQSVHLEIKNIKWYRIKTAVDKDRLSLLRFEKKEAVFIPGDKKDVPDMVKAQIENKSPFGFWQAQILVLVWQNQDLIGAGESSINQFVLAGTREIEVGLGVLSTTAGQDEDFKIDVLPYANIFDQGNLML